MKLVVAASSFYQTLKILGKKDRVTVDELVYSSSALNLDPNTTNCVYDYLSSSVLGTTY